LCPEHHRGNTGVHGLGAKGFEKRYNLTQGDLLEQTKALLGETIGVESLNAKNN
jgi:hypothetical protein